MSLRAQLWAIAGLTAVILIVSTLVDVSAQSLVSRELMAIERAYVPLLELGPRVQEQIEQLARAAQDAVAAQDEEALESLVVRRDALLRTLDEAPPIVVPAEVAAGKRAIIDWHESLSDVSRRLLRAETGEQIVEDIAVMQANRNRVLTLTRRTLGFERRHLDDAFQRARAVQRTAVLVVTLIRLGLLILVSALALRIARRAANGLNALTAGFARFGAGRLDEPVELPGNDEMSALAAHANQMAAHIADMRRGLERKQTELERAHAELEAFSYSVSHDLRQPLRAMDGFSQALLEDYADKLDDEGKDYLRIIRAAAQKLARLIDDLLKLSRVTRADLETTEVDLSGLAREVANELQTAEPERSVTFVIPDGLVIRADRPLLRQALANLLGNAWKFSSKRPDARVEVGTIAHEGEVVLFVRDNGAGFDMASADRLFGAFQRLHTEAEFPGTGIGLATVRRIAHRHGGRAWAEGAVGQGATFYIALPRVDGIGRGVAAAGDAPEMRNRGEGDRE